MGMERISFVLPVVAWKGQAWARADLSAHAKMQRAWDLALTGQFLASVSLQRQPPERAKVTITSYRKGRLVKDLLDLNYQHRELMHGLVKVRLIATTDMRYTSFRITEKSAVDGTQRTLVVIESEGPCDS